ncbi:hypothetical protein [Niveibacterium sp. SC-1]|uniref:hypothetical protein n=1 Tax=Niveibacterium sp. SC-1 TaxID=3135646 RepID=UPI00311EACBF
MIFSWGMSAGADAPSGAATFRIWLLARCQFRLAWQALQVSQINDYFARLCYNAKSHFMMQNIEFSLLHH